jgi:hypothetical protein
MKRVPTNLAPPDVRVYYSHIRYESDQPNQEFDTHGGITIAFRYLKEHKQWEVAIAKCNLVDNFNKKLGRKIASNRLDWGDCHRLDLNADDTELKKVVAYVRSYISEKEGMIWADDNQHNPSPTAPITGIIGESRIH